MCSAFRSLSIVTKAVISSISNCSHCCPCLPWFVLALSDCSSSRICCCAHLTACNGYRYISSASLFSYSNRTLTWTPFALVCCAHAHNSPIAELHTYTRRQVLFTHSMLVMQSARYLLKNLLGARSGRAPQGSASYLGNAKTEMKSKCEASSAKQWRDPAIQLAALRHVSRTAVHSLGLC